MSKKILVIDDDKEFLAELTEMLKNSEYEVISAKDGKEGLQKANLKPDVILLDLKMDVVDGFEVVQRLKSRSETSDIPIVAMTGYYSSDECKDLMGKGVTAIIKKPFNPLDIIAGIEEAAQKIEE